MNRFFTLRLGWLLLAVLLSTVAHAQDSLLAELNAQPPDSTHRELVQATFKGTRIINGHSVETPGPGTLVFLISHRFGRLNSGAYNLFGLDQATIRLGLEYGLTDRLAVGIGRSSVEKAYDGFVQYRALRQRAGGLPFSATLLASSAINTLRYSAAADGFEHTFAHRLTYTWQALLARKFSPALSVQLMPTVVHRNLVGEKATPNDVYALGFAGRQKFTKRMAFTWEYYYRLPGSRIGGLRDALGAGLDIETGGHVFQLHVTNANSMITQQFIPSTSGRFFKGDLYFGFNVARNFTLKPGL
ncbi:DUF5777 family beta-barrel protein [Hymenobacter metallilatus]|uniref:DUF5777 domain-containing protein n=1 Tax=Hymenobacter metallilatus TaxID=2493666 RepID=A0A428JPX3_9BACT|nr:DUF5777 family beta-barrel protein [Hymenobacter metallilatus]RSK35331.1 hypothetical protein EI290_06430 [Hymenobacter metallilatus]